MDSEQILFPVRLVFASPTEPEPIVDQVYADRASLLHALVPIAGRTNILEITDRLLCGETIMLGEKVLAVFARAA